MKLHGAEGRSVYSDIVCSSDVFQVRSVGDSVTACFCVWNKRSLFQVEVGGSSSKTEDLQFELLGHLSSVEKF